MDYKTIAMNDLLARQGDIFGPRIEALKEGFDEGWDACSRHEGKAKAIPAKGETMTGRNNDGFGNFITAKYFERVWTGQEHNCLKEGWYAGAAWAREQQDGAPTPIEFALKELRAENARCADRLESIDAMLLGIEGKLTGKDAPQSVIKASCEKWLSDIDPSWGEQQTGEPMYGASQMRFAYAAGAKMSSSAFDYIGDAPPPATDESGQSAGFEVGSKADSIFQKGYDAGMHDRNLEAMDDRQRIEKLTAIIDGITRDNQMSSHSMSDRLSKVRNSRRALLAHVGELVEQVTDLRLALANAQHGDL